MVHFGNFQPQYIDIKNKTLPEIFNFTFSDTKIILTRISPQSIQHFFGRVAGRRTSSTDLVSNSGDSCFVINKLDCFAYFFDRFFGCTERKDLSISFIDISGSVYQNYRNKTSHRRKPVNTSTSNASKSYSYSKTGMWQIRSACNSSDRMRTMKEINRSGTLFSLESHQCCCFPISFRLCLAYSE